MKLATLTVFVVLVLLLLVPLRALLRLRCWHLMIIPRLILRLLRLTVLRLLWS